MIKIKLAHYIIVLCSLLYLNTSIAATYKAGVVLLKHDTNSHVSESDFKQLILNAQTQDEIYITQDIQTISFGIWEVSIKNIGVIEALDIYGAIEGILWVEPDYILRSFGAVNDAEYQNGNQWYLKATEDDEVHGINIEEAWDMQTDCSSVPVSVIDTGVNYQHQDLKENIYINSKERQNADNTTLLTNSNNGIDDDNNGYIDDFYGWDFVDKDSNPVPEDADIHGTHVAGIIGATGNNNIATSGVCQSASILPLRALDAIGGILSDIVQAIEYSVDNNAKIINMSLGVEETVLQGQEINTMKTAIEYATVANVLTIAAAGNGGTDEIADNNDANPVYPCNYVDICVTSVGGEFKLTTLGFANYGKESVDLAAPGVSIISSVPGTVYEYDGVNAFVIDDAGNNTQHLYLEYTRLAVASNTSFILTIESKSETKNFDTNLRYNLEECINKTCTITINLQPTEKLVAYSVADDATATYYQHGTSMASPLVAGVAALVWSFNPNYNYLDVKNAILDTVQTGGDDDSAINLANSTASGGVLDAYAAIKYTTTPELLSAVIVN